MVNCSQTIPHVEEFMRGLSPVTWVFLVILLAMSLSSCALFMELWVYMSRNVSCTVVKVNSLIVLGLFPVISVAALVGMTVPRAATVVYLAISAYTGVTLLVFFHLTLAYLGGEVEMLDKMQSVDCIVRAGPCCCCCFCLPRTPMNRRTFKILKRCVYQTNFMIPVLTFITAVLWADGHYYHQEDVDSPIFYMRILMGISNMLAMYGFNVMVRTSLHVADLRCHLRAKYYILLALVVINGLQPFIFELLTTYDIIPCTAQFSWQGRASEFHHMAHVVEAFLLMLLARVFYRKPYPLHETEPLLSVDNSLLYMPL